MIRPRLHLAEAPFAPGFGQRGELRQAVGEAGRAHLDRWLPFLVLHRSPEPAASIARRVAVNSPAYLIWSPDDDRAAGQAFAAIAAALQQRFGSILVIAVDDAAWEPVPKGSQKLHPFDIHIGATGGPAARRALDCLTEALAKIRIDLRKPTIVQGAPEPPPIALDAGFDFLSVTIPQIHRLDEHTFYPQLTRDLAVALGDALLQAACAFMAASGADAPAHFRSLGRSAFLAAALDADKKLDRVARSFDFLLSVSPINSHEAMQRFFAGGEADAPKFRYRPLTVDPDVAKRELYEIDLSRLEDLRASPSTVRALYAFLGLPWQDSIFSIFQRPHNVNRPVDTPLTPDQAARFSRIAGAMMERLEYAGREES